MKRIIFFLSVLAFVVLFIPTAIAYANDEIRVYLDGERLVFDVPPQIIDGRTMVPMCVIIEALGAHIIRWDENDRTISAIVSETRLADNRLERVEIELRIDRGYINIFRRADGIWYDLGEYGMYYKSVPIMVERVELDVPPQIVNGRTLVPLRAVSEVFGAEVAWNSYTRTVTIKTQ